MGGFDSARSAHREHSHMSSQVEQYLGFASIGLFFAGFLCPVFWTCSACCLPSKNGLAKLFGVFGASLYALLSLGTVLGIMTYLIVFVPWFNLTPQYDRFYG